MAFKQLLSTVTLSGLRNSPNVFVIHHNDVRILNTATIPWECLGVKHLLSIVTLLV